MTDLEWFFNGDFAWDEDFTELGVEWDGKYGRIYADINHDCEIEIKVSMIDKAKSWQRKTFDLRDPELAPFLSKARKMIENGMDS
jgi:hypothetical protein